MSTMDEPRLAFAVDPQEQPAIEIQVNFGVFAGRAATPAEIDRLAAELLREGVDAVTIVSEERHEIDASAEASVHLVRVEVGAGRAPEESVRKVELERRLVDHADRWARECIADRQIGAAEG
jgi:hypothetical protein